MPLLKPPVAARINRQHHLSKGLVGAWLLNEGGGTKAFDATGFGNHGTLTNGPLWTPGNRGQALRLDGTNDFVSIPHSVSLAPTLLTVSIWAMSRNVSIVNDLMYKKASSTDVAFAFVPVADSLRFYTGTTATSNNAAIIPSGILVNAWYHYVGVYDGANTKLYQNGKLIANAATPVGPTSTSSVFKIGDDFTSTGGGRNFPGSIDSVLIYNRALTAAEIRQLYVDPYCFIDRDAPTFGKGATLVPLSWSATGATAISNALSVSRRLAIAPVGATAFSEAISVQRNLALPVTGQTSLTETIQVTRPMGLATAGQTAFSESIQVGRALAVSISGATSVSFNAQVGRQFGWSSTGNSNFSEGLEVSRSISLSTQGGAAFSEAISVSRTLSIASVGSTVVTFGLSAFDALAVRFPVVGRIVNTRIRTQAIESKVVTKFTPSAITA